MSSVRASLTKKLNRISMAVGTEGILKAGLGGKEKNFTIALLGPSQVGKTTLTKLYLSGEEVTAHEPTIEEVHYQLIKFSAANGITIEAVSNLNSTSRLAEDELVIKLQVVDTAGEAEYSALRDGYKLSVDGIMGVYDVADEKTVKELIEILKPFVEARKESMEKPLSLILVGNKTDLGIKVNKEQVSAMLEKQLGVEGDNIFEVNMKDAKNVSKAFLELVKQVVTNESLKNMLQEGMEAQKAEKKKMIEKSRKSRSFHPGNSDSGSEEKETKKKHGCKQQ